LKRQKRQLEKEKAPDAAEYNFFPVTYNLPGDYYFFKDEYNKVKQKEKAIWIMKPVTFILI
jgi:tubulin polyglutamylase TTLL9